jgi:RNA polymerase sigma-70 factor (ECF subfamily)
MDAADVGEALPDEIPGLLRFARTLLRDPVGAEDLVQDTVTRALERAESFRGDSALGTWLHRIMHNLAVDQARRDREVPVEDVVDTVEARWREDGYTVDAAVVAARAETRAELEDALVHLPVAYRSAVLLHDAEGMTVQQIAAIQGIGLSAAKQRLRRGRMMMVSELARGAERRSAQRGVPMRCWDARSLVSDFIDGELSVPDAARVERHLQVCPTCPPLYAGLVATRAAVRATRGRDPDSVVPPDLATRLAIALDRPPE